jgi:hypothetical protein
MTMPERKLYVLPDDWNVEPEYPEPPQIKLRMLLIFAVVGLVIWGCLIVGCIALWRAL